MRSFFLSFFSFILVTTAISAQDKTYKNEVGIQSDNDGFLAQGSDRYYTAGNFGYYRHALKINDKDSSKLANKILGFELGQKIFNPQTGAIPNPVFIDRPFAGYFYVGANLNLLYKNESNLKLQGRLGIVGQHAYGEQIQDLIHTTFGFYHPTGWESQIKDAFQLNLSAEYNRLLNRSDIIDLSLSSYANLGTGITGAGAGLLTRLGRFNQLFNSASTNSTVSQNSRIKPLHDNELFFYYKPILNLVGYDATIQGDLFRSEPRIGEVVGKPVPIVLTQQVGGCIVTGHWMFDVSATYQTRETKEMIARHDGHQWGSVVGVYRF